MTKKEIYKYLERKMNIALREVYDQSEQEAKMLRSQVLERIGMPELAEKLQVHFDAVADLWTKWRQEAERMEPDLKMNPYYDGIDAVIQKFATEKDSTYQYLLHKGFSLDEMKSYDDLVQQGKLLKEGVERSYKTVYSTVYSMKNAKMAAEYLRELGFDLSELEQKEEPEITALAVQVDTRFLFIGGEQKATAA